MSDFYQWSTVVTRKEHKCDGCLTVIPKGKKVETCKGRNEAGFYKIYVCDDCIDHLNEYRDHFEDGWATGDIGIDRREMEKNQEISSVA